MAPWPAGRGPDGGDLSDHGQPDALEVNRIDTVEVGLGDLVQRTRLDGGGGVVEGDVETPVQRHGTVDRGVDARRVGQVAQGVVRAAARRPDLVGHRLQLSFRAGGQQHLGALTGEQPGRGRADAAAGAGDEQGLSRERRHLLPTGP